jgi:hypothetical protein
MHGRISGKAVGTCEKGEGIVWASTHALSSRLDPGVNPIYAWAHKWQGSAGTCEKREGIL